MFDRRRPDPAQGVFETLLVLDGRPVELDAHLARLRASLAELFPDRNPPPLDARDGLGALRITVAPRGDGELEARIEWRDAPRDFSPDSGNKTPAGAISLHCLTLHGGLGAHKWADRSLLDEAQAKLPGDALPLIVDEDGAVLEAARANVFAVRDGSLFTPPLDGRILPGVTRMRVLELAGKISIDVHEAELSCAGLLAADEVFLTGSVRGIERVRFVDGAPLGGGDDVTDRLATELWQAWTGARTALR